MTSLKAARFIHALKWVVQSVSSNESSATDNLDINSIEHSFFQFSLSTSKLSLSMVDLELHHWMTESTQHRKWSLWSRRILETTRGRPVWPGVNPDVELLKKYIHNLASAAQMLDPSVCRLTGGKINRSCELTELIWDNFAQGKYCEQKWAMLWELTMKLLSLIFRTNLSKLSVNWDKDKYRGLFLSKIIEDSLIRIYQWH